MDSWFSQLEWRQYASSRTFSCIQQTVTAGNSNWTRCHSDVTNTRVADCRPGSAARGVSMQEELTIGVQVLMIVAMASSGGLRNISSDHAITHTLTFRRRISRITCCRMQSAYQPPLVDIHFSQLQSTAYKMFTQKGWVSCKHTLIMANGGGEPTLYMTRVVAGKSELVCDILPPRHRLRSCVCSQ